MNPKRTRVLVLGIQSCVLVRVSFLVLPTSVCPVFLNPLDEVLEPEGNAGEGPDVMKVDYQLFALAPSPQINGDHFVILHLDSVMFVADGHFLVLRPCLDSLTDLSFQLPD